VPLEQIEAMTGIHHGMGMLVLKAQQSIAQMYHVTYHVDALPQENQVVGSISPGTLRQKYWIGCIQKGMTT